MLDEGLRLAVAAAGSRYKLAQRLKLTPTAVANWHEIPLRRLLEVERVTGVDRTRLRPDLYDRSLAGEK